MAGVCRRNHNIKKLILPSVEAEGSTKLPYTIETFWEKEVSAYSGLNLAEVLDLEVDDFLFLRRESFISQLSKTEEGRKLLEDAWINEQTEPDYAGLRKLQKKLEGGS